MGRSILVIILLVVLLLVVAAVISRRGGERTAPVIRTAPSNSPNTSSQASRSSPEAWRETDYSSIRSVTFYVFPFDPDVYYEELEKAIPTLKSVGFNAIWIVNPWKSFNPKPLANPPVYDDARFDHLENVLRLLKENGMEAILGLNYLGKGWSPEGIDPGRWITDPKMYHAFEVYVDEFLRRIEPYHDMVYIVVFTEGTEPECLNPYRDAKRHAEVLRGTLGSLPTRIDPSLRREFRIGYHDYSLINLNWSGGVSPIPQPNPFDFVSMVFYGWEDRSDEEIRHELERRASNFKALYPGKPLIVGELGASICEGGEENQARVIAAKVSKALESGYGFNVWHWRPIPGEDECRNVAFRGLSLTSEDGSPRPVVEALRELLSRTVRS